jgi:recombination protein RecT
LGDHAQSFLASVLSIVSQDEKLAQCDPNSILIAALKAATLDLPIEPSLGQAYIVAYGGKDGYKAQFQPGWRGFVQLALRTDQYTHLNVTEIYEGEEIIQNRLTGAITLNGKRSSDRITGYCGYFRLKNGFEKFLYMTVPELDAFGKRYSKSYSFNNSAWKTNTDDMYRKTVLKQLLSKYGLLSIDHALSEAVKVDNEVDSVLAEVRDVTQEPVAEKEEKVGKKRQKTAAPISADPVTGEILPGNPRPTEPPEPEYPPEPIEPEQQAKSPSDEALWKEPEQAPEVTVGDRDVPLSQWLAVHKYFTSELMAKTALRFYTGNINDMNAVVTWATKANKLIAEGATLAQAAQKAN